MEKASLVNLQIPRFRGTVYQEIKAVYTLAILPDARTVRERFAAGCPCTHCVHCVGFVRYTETTSGGVRSGRERTVRGGLALQCECSSGRAGRVG